MRLVFMGTPEFAVPSLIKLYESSHIVKGVVTQPDRPKGRGLQLAASPVKQAALGYDLPILQPEDLKDPSFLMDLEKMDPECFVVVGFRILPPVVFEMPSKGTINLHGSLLPRYRGAAPIQWAIMNGENKTGVTTFFIEKRVDTGDLILQREVPIDKTDTAGTLHDRMALVGSELLLKTVDAIEKNKAHGIAQKGHATPAPKITKEHCRIDWTHSSISIANQIRALSPYPGAFTFLNGQRAKLFCASSESKCGQDDKLPGRVLDSRDDFIALQTGDGILRFAEIQIEGKKRMTVKAFLKGHSLEKGDLFGLSDTGTGET